MGSTMNMWCHVALLMYFYNLQLQLQINSLCEPTAKIIYGPLLSSSLDARRLTSLRVCGMFSWCVII